MFSGARPKLANHLLAPGEAQTAQNCKLDKGELRSWKDYEFTQNIEGLGTPATLYLYQDDNVDYWITDEDLLDFARTAVARDPHSRLYYTGKDEPRVLANDLISDPFDFDTDYYKLGVPAPTAAATVDSGYTAGNEYRAYVYSYVVRLGGLDAEEGPPSDTVSITDYGSGAVTLSGFAEPPADRQIGKIRIYRTNAATTGVAAFQYVGDFETDGVDFDTFTYDDTVAEANLGTDSPQPETYLPPPTNLTGLIALINGSFAGFYQNVVCVSEPFLPHAWPYEYPVAATIIGLARFGNTGVVLTDSNPYILIGPPEAMEVMPLDDNYPCLSKRGIVMGKNGVLYPTEMGYALVDQNGVRIVTESFIDPTTWKDVYHPTSLHAYFYEDRIFGFHATGSFIIDFPNDRFTTLDIYPDACHVARGTGSFYVVKPIDDTDRAGDHAIYKWEGVGYDRTQYTWKSKRRILPHDSNFSVACITRNATDLAAIQAIIDTNIENIEANAAAAADADIGDVIDFEDIGADVIQVDDLAPVYDIDMNTDITFKFYGDGVLLHTETVQDNDPFRLPSDILYGEVEYEIIGYVAVKEVRIATSVEELMDNPAIHDRSMYA
jgi:hypothetical protein